MAVLPVAPVTLVVLAGRLGLASLVIQIRVHFDTHGAFDDWNHEVLDHGRRNWPFDDLAQQFSGQSRWRSTGGRPCGNVSFLLHRSSTLVSESKTRRPSDYAYEAATKVDAENGPLAKGALTSDEPQD